MSVDERGGDTKAGEESLPKGAEESAGDEGKEEHGSPLDDAIGNGAEEAEAGSDRDASGKDAGGAWLSQLPEGLRASFKKYPKLVDAANAFVAQGKALSDLQEASKGLIKPVGKGAKPEEIAAFKKALGIPLKAEEYDLEGMKIPEGLEIPEERLKSLRETAAKWGLSKGQAKGILSELLLWQVQTEAKRQTILFPDPEKAMASLKEEWGDEYSENRTAFMRYVREFADDELRDLVLNSPLGNNKSFIRSAVRIGKSIGESGFVEGRNTPAKSEDEDEYDHSPELRRRR